MHWRGRCIFDGFKPNQMRNVQVDVRSNRVVGGALTLEVGTGMSLPPFHASPAVLLDHHLRHDSFL